MSKHFGNRKLILVRPIFKYKINAIWFISDKEKLEGERFHFSASGSKGLKGDRGEPEEDRIRLLLSIVFTKEVKSSNPQEGSR